MSGTYNPIQGCDSECAFVNNCQCGGVVCETCGRYFCSTEIDENEECPDCASMRENEDDDEEGEEEDGD